MRHMFCDRLCLSSVVEMGVCFLEVAGLDCSYPVCPGVRDAAIILSWGANQQESSSCINLSQNHMKHYHCNRSSTQANCATPSSPDPKTGDQGGWRFFGEGGRMEGNWRCKALRKMFCDWFRWACQACVWVWGVCTVLEEVVAMLCVCVCRVWGDWLEGFVTFREYGDVASFCGGSLPCMWRCELLALVPTFSGLFRWMASHMPFGLADVQAERLSCAIWISSLVLLCTSWSKRIYCRHSYTQHRGSYTST